MLPALGSPVSGAKILSRSFEDRIFVFFSRADFRLVMMMVEEYRVSLKRRVVGKHNSIFSTKVAEKVEHMLLQGRFKVGNPNDFSVVLSQ